MTESDLHLRSQLKWLIALRIVVGMTLLLSALIIQFATGTILPIDYLYRLTGLTCVLSIIYIVLGNWLQWLPSRVLAYGQLGGDLLIITGLVYFTGGVESSFSFLYLISIIVASILLYRRGGLVIASLAGILYGVLADLMYLHLLHNPLPMVLSQDAWPVSRIYYNIVTNFLGFYATAFLTSFISEKLRTARAELEATTVDLAEAKALNQNIINSISSGLITTDLDGHVTFINRVGEEILGVGLGQLRGRYITETVLAAPDWSAVLARSSDNETVRFESTLTVRGVSAFLGFSFTLLRTADGLTDGYILVFQDLTELKKLETAVRIKDRMAAVGEMAAGIAHEIRNPLASISGSVQVLQRAGVGSSEDRKLMEIILKESNRLDQILQNFLRYARPRDTSLSRFDVTANLNDTLLLLRNSSEVTGAHRFDIEIPAVPILIHGDADQLKQIWWNLAKNAVRAMPAGGVLAVRSELRGEVLVVAFRDSGHGMTNAERARLFQPFKTSFDGGSGLGMAIVYRIVEQHQGHIGVESTPGGGTTVTVELPAAAREAATINP